MAEALNPVDPELRIEVWHVQKITDAFKGIREGTQWHKEFGSEAPKVDDMAPDFSLADVMGENPIRLSDFIDKKPVALVFGSFTWPPFVKGAVSLRDLYRDYNDKIQFILVYIREAHPTDGWYMGDHDIRQHQSMEEWREVAGMCEVALQYGIKTYVDEMDDAVAKAYAFLPDRLYLVGLGGKIVYAGSRGPFGFKPAELKQAIANYL